MQFSTLRMLAVALVCTLLTACGPNIYLANDFRSYAPKHKTVAILPATVTMQLRPNQARNTTAEQQRDLEAKSGIDFQEKIYAWLLRRSQQRGYTVQFQDVMRTNSLLRESNIPYGELRTHSPQELAKLLGVDAVLTTSVRTSKPMSDGAAVAVGLLVGAWGATNQANITVDIHEADAGKLLWKYDYVASGSVGSSTEGMVGALMRNASKKFPYTPKS
ncbi:MULTISPECIES: hypothetical protein [Hymenobacter]|uniref:DUF3313 domain-containing protein n=1 Tax=Hymenobacter jejuensis TaxID=2502781 RepID=A0A5B8A1F1_9BACT|nr:MULTISPECIES: hypothetical protein [Hymenobacter]MBC6990641.1 hypothetical protein [Hymenobacter sp. BT491]QDA60947.1 hypothetical protein FHG12_12910 [Hymenobacter jejuensis]